MPVADEGAAHVAGDHATHASGSITRGHGPSKRLPGMYRAETWVDYLERVQGLDTEAVSLGYLLGRIGHRRAHEAGLTAVAEKCTPRSQALCLGRGGMHFRRVFNHS